MPRKAFIADLQAAVANELPLGFSNLAAGDEDGSLKFTYQSPRPDLDPIVLQAQVTDVGDYPSDHSFLVYTASEGDTTVNDSVTDPSNFDGLKVSAFVNKIAKLLNETTIGSMHNPVPILDDDEDEYDDEADFMDADEGGIDELQDEESDEFDEYDDGLDFDGVMASKPALIDARTEAGKHATEAETRQANARIRADLRRAKDAGFHVSCYGTPFDHSRDFYLTLSCRIAKLNISEDALAAWNLARKKYILLIKHYTNGYKTLDEVQQDSAQGRSTVQFRLAVCKRSKASRQDTISIFSSSDDKGQDASTIDAEGSEPDGHLESFFIDRPLNELLNHRFLDVLRIRKQLNMSWDGAERYCQDNQAMGRAMQGSQDPDYYVSEPILWKTAPKLGIADHFSSREPSKSFPLIAMEFMLRHLIQCTDFCLVCHTRLQADFEALKPYVCSKPLCLYQYMALGFGPSMEHEIIAQPYVVDLLVSFCYSRALASQLKDLPVGMGLTVPNPADITPLADVNSPPPYRGASKQADKGPASNPGSWKALYDEPKDQLRLSPTDAQLQLKAGDWISIRLTRQKLNGADEEEEIHRRVLEVWHPVIRLARGRGDATPNRERPDLAVLPSEDMVDVTVTPFHSKFDDLSIDAQRKCILYFADRLPKILEMKEELTSNRSKPLSHLYPDISPAAFGILRWIIASNRSCIVAIDDPASDKVNATERVRGMPNYMQFRFAQGAPDKEQRFLAAVNENSSRSKPQHPTLWAWHGSALSNWHSIIREGLHFANIANGRAYGNGVYHALDAQTSMGYTGWRGGTYNTNGKTRWPQSTLNIGTALSLNEIVNAPDKFQSASPYLVVQHVDWIQTRYLFVSCDLAQEERQVLEDSKDQPPLVDPLDQDKKLFPRGVNGVPIILPANAISAARRAKSGLIKQGLKKLKLFGGSKDAEEYAYMSDATDAEDRALVEEQIFVQSQASKTVKGAQKTDYVPGALDVSTLPRLPEPNYATSQASKALNRELKALQKLQGSNEPAELGWHLCEEALDNMYQWIVELHTFDASLPLHKDLKDKGLKSVVLELRFGPSYPFSPPFVRVVRPRFLGFQQGGGGHVTAGGALCMELLTNDGWSAVSSIEAVLLQIHMAISSTDPRPAKLQPGPPGEYGAGEAIDAFKRACNLHGWTIPPDFRHIESQPAGGHHFR